MRPLVLAVLLLVGAACGDDDPTLVAPQSSTTAVAPAGEAPATTEAGSGAENGGDPAVPDTSSAGSSPAPPAAPSPASGWPALDGSGAPGSFADDVLRGDRSARVEVQVLTQAGAEPRQGTLDHLASVLRTVTGGKEVVLTGGTVAGDRSSWSADDLRAAAGDVRQGDGTAVLRVVFVHGRYSEAEGVLGVTVRGDAAAVFADEVDASGSPLVGAAAIEDAVVVHELGHLLGLVDLHLDTGRDDPEHPGHSTNRRSVMYWAVESTLVADVLQGGPPRDFDDADLADLAAIRGG